MDFVFRKSSIFIIYPAKLFSTSSHSILYPRVCSHCQDSLNNGVRHMVSMSKYSVGLQLPSIVTIVPIYKKGSNQLFSNRWKGMGAWFACSHRNLVVFQSTCTFVLEIYKRSMRKRGVGNYYKYFSGHLDVKIFISSLQHSRTLLGLNTPTFVGISILRRITAQVAFSEYEFRTRTPNSSNHDTSYIRNSPLIGMS